MPFVAAGSNPQSNSGGWSNLIGIVTAIVGNLLISFALNVQRYAHIRLEREQNREQEAYDLRKHKHLGQLDYGTVQAHIADDRAQENARAPAPSDVNSAQEEENNISGASEALIPSLDIHQNDHHSGEDTDADTQAQRKNYLRSPYWWIGITLMTIGEAGNFLAYGFAPASIVSPLGVVALISNCLIAPIMLHERFRLRDLVGVVIAVGGAVTVVVSATGSNPKLGPEEMWRLIQAWEFLVYLGVTLLTIVVFMVLSNRYGGKTIAIDLGLVGLFGGYTALSTKGVASLLSYKLWRVLTFPISYLLVAVLAITAVMQIKYVNRALQRFDSTRVIPTQFVCFTISVVIGSAILYRDFENMTKEKLLEFFGGCALTFLGVWFLTSGDRGRGDDGARTVDEEHGTIDMVDDEAAYARQGHYTDGQEPSTPKLTVGGVPQRKSAGESISSAGSDHLQQVQHPPLLTAQSTPLLGNFASSAPSRFPFNQHTASPSRRTPRGSADAGDGGLQQTPPLLTPRDSSSSASALRTPRAVHGVVPGPLTTPLSSGLSVVIADQRGKLRRGQSVRTPGRGHEDRTAGAGSVQQDRPSIGMRGATVEVTPGNTASRSESDLPYHHGSNT
ncbi:MAG: hypothetical protein M1831_002898 [Alyxoria varia]|nr:MAG: hypothetical protein M1831_002898 [Alyxoria varia]